MPQLWGCFLDRLLVSCWCSSLIEGSWRIASSWFTPNLGWYQGCHRLFSDLWLSLMTLNPHTLATKTTFYVLSRMKLVFAVLGSQLAFDFRLRSSSHPDKVLPISNSRPASSHLRPLPGCFHKTLKSHSIYLGVTLAFSREAVSQSQRVLVFREAASFFDFCLFSGSFKPSRLLSLLVHPSTPLP